MAAVRCISCSASAAFWSQELCLLLCDLGLSGQQVSCLLLGPHLQRGAQFSGKNGGSRSCPPTLVSDTQVSKNQCLGHPGALLVPKPHPSTAEKAFRGSIRGGPFELRLHTL